MNTRKLVRTISLRVEMEIPSIDSVSDAIEFLGENEIIRLADRQVQKEAIQRARTRILNGDIDFSKFEFATPGPIRKRRAGDHR